MPAPVLQFKRGNAGVAGTVPALRPGEPAISLNNFDFFIGIDTSVANNKFFGSHRYWGREDGTNSLKLKLVDKDGTNYLAIKSPDTLAGIVTYQLPGTQGLPNSVLTNDGTGVLTWGSGSDNAVFSGITTVNGTFLDVNVDADFSGITTFSNTTDNTLGDSNTGAVQINGGLGVDKNVTIGANLNVQGYSEFVGVVTFKGGVINLGDDTTDVIDLNGRIGSDLVPTTDNTYDVGISTLNWRHAHFSGIGTFENGAHLNNINIGIGISNRIEGISGVIDLYATEHVLVSNDLHVGGNVTIGGTTVTLKGEDVFISNKDIVLGFTTSGINYTPNDDTANHAGVAIASTEGTPLVSFTASGINTLPDTYKQMMWFKSGTLGFGTDMFGLNYGLAVGTTTVADGVRLAVGTDVRVTDTTVTAPVGNFTTLAGSLTGTISTATRAYTVDTQTAGNSNSTYYMTFVDSHNTSVSAENVYTDDGIYYNPGTNTFTTQNATFTGDVAVDGGDLTTTATTFNLVNANATTINFGSAATALVMASASGITTISNSLTVGGDLQVTGNDIKDSGGGAVFTFDGSQNVTANHNLTVQGNLFVNGNTTQIDTTSLTVEDRTIELGRVNGAVPTNNTTWDLGVLFNYRSSNVSKKSAVVWEHNDSRFKFASILDADTNGTDVDTPQLTVNTFAPIEVASLWVTDCAGTSQVISCTGTERFLENITVDAGTF